MNSKFSTPYEGYDVLDKWDTPSWNDMDREVIRKRLTEVPKREFFTPEEWDTLQAVCDRLIPQPDRADDSVPITPWIDRKLHENQGDGYQKTTMPPMREAWRLGLQGIQAESARRFGRSFPQLNGDEQDALLRDVQQGNVEDDTWQQLPAQEFFTGTLLRTVTSVYYAHPAAWSEIGYGGPASIRGYVRLGFNGRDAWEAKKRHD